MRAATIVDGELVVREHPDPVPGTGEVLVRSARPGSTAPTWRSAAARYPAPPGWPQDIPGMELAGEVAALGPGATRFAVGDRVMAIVGGGAQAELRNVHERTLMPVPGRHRLGRRGRPRRRSFTTAHDALFTPVRPRRPASGCSSTARPAASARPPCSSASRPARA